jgi:hypothetical protein
MIQIFAKRALARRYRIACAVPLAAVFLLAAAPLPAWSFESRSAGGGQAAALPDGVALDALPAARLQRAPAPAGDARCEALLRPAAFAQTALPREQTMMDRDADPAQAAAIGLIFGIHFALGPKQVVRRGGGPQFDVWEPNAGGSKALAIAAYSRCRREAALQALANGD